MSYLYKDVNWNAVEAEQISKISSFEILHEVNLIRHPKLQINITCLGKLQKFPLVCWTEPQNGSCKLNDYIPQARGTNYSPVAIEALIEEF